MTAGERKELFLVGLVVACACVLAIELWVPANWQSGLDRAERLWGLPVADAGRWFSAWSFGDGQAFAVIALDPLGFGEGENLGSPGYRYARAGFGWLVWMASLGQPALIPYAMTLVGALAVIGLMVLAAKLRPGLGPLAWLICLNPAVFLALNGGTAESVAVLLIALGFWSRKWGWSAALGLVRPSYLLGHFGRGQHLLAGAIVALTMGLFTIWQFGWDPTQYGGALTYPAAGYFRQADFGAWIVGILGLVTAIVGLTTRDWTWVASGIFVMSFSPAVTVNYHSAVRAAGFLPVLWAFGPNYGVQGRSRSDMRRSESEKTLDNPTSTTSGANARAELFPKSHTQLDETIAKPVQAMIGHCSQVRRNEKTIPIATEATEKTR
jgi:hypothetical protein